MGRAVKGMINGEMFIVAVGLGGVVKSDGQRFDAAGVLAVLLVIVCCAGDPSWSSCSTRG